jgi:hypothetical protein
MVTLIDGEQLGVLVIENSLYLIYIYIYIYIYKLFKYSSMQPPLYNASQVDPSGNL